MAGVTVAAQGATTGQALSSGRGIHRESTSEYRADAVPGRTCEISTPTFCAAQSGFALFGVPS